MLNSKNLAIVKEFGDKIEFTIARFHCSVNYYTGFRQHNFKNVVKFVIFGNLLKFS